MSNTVHQPRREPKNDRSDAIILQFPGSNVISEPNPADEMWARCILHGIGATPEMLEAAGEHDLTRTMAGMSDADRRAQTFVAAMLVRISERTRAILNPALP